MAGPTDGPSDEPSHQASDEPSVGPGPTGSAVEPAPEAEAPPELELLTLRDGLPEVVETPAALAEAIADLAGGTGPIAIDAERASGYRYSARAYLIQLRRAGSTSWLVDPIAFDDLAPLREVLDTDEWILHAASQDLACLREVGLEPPSLFDTELAARLLGHPRVGLAALTEEICGKRMRKEHSAADWSVRPLPRAWLDYAALDVELLGEIRDVLAEELREAGKQDWARQEFEHVLAQRPVARTDPWRRTSQMHKARGRRGVAVVRELWIARDRIAERRDVTPGRIIPDSAIVAAANAMPTDRAALLGTRGFHGRGAERYTDTWLEAIDTARRMPEAELPPVSLPANGPPPPRAWADRKPEAAGRLAAARPALVELSERVRVPVENLLTPDFVRRLMWSPPALTDPATGPGAVSPALATAMTQMGARPWQVELVGPLLESAIRDPAPVPSKPEPTATEPTEG